MIMRDTIVVLLCLLLAFGIACTDQNEPEAEPIEPIETEIPTQTLTETEAPEEETDPETARIAGWWYVTEGAAGAFEVMMHFGADGRVFLTPIQYEEGADDPNAYCCYWQNKGGQLYFVDVAAEDEHPPYYCILNLREDDTMSIMWSSESKLYLKKVSDEEAAEIRDRIVAAAEAAEADGE